MSGARAEKGLLKEIFAMFHWNDPNEKVLTDEIQKLFTRRLLE